MTTAKNAVFIGLKLENCCSEVGEIKIWGEEGGLESSMGKFL